ncbi:MAG: hypothetical protein K2F57_03730 [Candidatus Gastranaerophilales bacterium]|nr:hypothetical protein [Candidatus Gastranaerophilales bacterium]
MTNYIEDMMKTAGVEPVYIVKENSERMKAKAIFHKKNEAENYQKKFGGELSKGFNFTAEKQLEIIKFIGSRKDFYINIAGAKWELSALSDSNFDGILEIQNQDFTQALAQLTTELMNTGELDKEIVKEILEDAR